MKYYTNAIGLYTRWRQKQQEERGHISDASRKENYGSTVNEIK